MPRLTLCLTGLLFVLGCDGGPGTPDSGPRDSGVDASCGSLSACHGACVDLTSDSNHCGSCDNACDPGATCQGSLCGAPPQCNAPYHMCGAVCLDTRSDHDHCGNCTTACMAGELCQLGMCRAQCGDTLALCGTDCADLNTDPAHCSSCDTPCDTGMSCVAGACQPGCVPPTELCPSGACVDTTSDPLNCGSCNHMCSSGMSCMGSTCTPPPPGESCINADVMPTTGGSMDFTFAGYVPNHTPFTCGSRGMRVDHAFRWTANRTGTATFMASGPNTGVDTMLAVFSSSACDASVALGCNDDRAPGSDYGSTVMLSVTAGTLYYIVIAPYIDPPPPDTITVTITPP